MDTLIHEPRLQLDRDLWIVRLPSEMARLLNDSLPGFAPYDFSGWKPQKLEEGELPSVVVGDFNGDKTPDIAMHGRTASESAFFLLLSKSDSVPQPRLFIVNRGGSPERNPDIYIGLIHPKQFEGNVETDPFDLRTDAALWGWADKAASIYFIEKGALASYSVAD